MPMMQSTLYLYLQFFTLIYAATLPTLPTLTSNIVYKINHAIIDVPNVVDTTHHFYSIGIRSSFPHRLSKTKWKGDKWQPIVICTPLPSFPLSPPSPPSSFSLPSFNTTFLSCSDVWNNKIKANYNDPIQFMRAAGFPCKDETIHDTDGLTRRHILEGYVMLPNEQAMIGVTSSFITCHLCNNNLDNNNLDNNNLDLDRCLLLNVPTTIRSQQVQLVTSGASRASILNASQQHMNSNTETSGSTASPPPAPAPPPPSSLHKILTFLETNEWMATTGMPGMKQILAPAIDGVMKPVVNTVAQQVGPELSAPLTEDMAHGLNEELPGDVAAMLEQTLTANLTNILTDSITMRLSDSLTTSLTNELGTYLDTSITDAAQPRLHTAIHNILSETVPRRLNRDIPTLLIRSLKIGLVQTLTRSVTHSLVPSLALSLTHNKRQDYFCYLCFQFHLYCRLCHYSPQSAYYLQYYSGYYSDYFSTFYADYYTQALVNIDTLEHPLSHWKGKSGPGGAEKGNGYQLSTEKGKMLKEVENARDRKMPQHTSLNTKMLQSKNGESLGREQKAIRKGDVNHKGVGG